MSGKKVAAVEVDDSVRVQLQLPLPLPRAVDEGVEETGCTSFAIPGQQPPWRRWRGAPPAVWWGLSGRRRRREEGEEMVVAEEGERLGFGVGEKERPLAAL